MQFLFFFCFLLLVISLTSQQGTISFGIGFLLVLMGWAVTGMILEAYGFIILFRFMFFFLLLFFLHMCVCLLFLFSLSAYDFYMVHYAVAFGLHFQSSCKGFPLLDGYSNNLM